ncbi:MAG: hypothetical protein HKN23_18350 [Verrucomicrobiales bacterium]|nr:hypothetical protein [Verrucomicrobiales bacterium]
MKRNLQNKKNSKGFSLPELLGIVAVIGILATAGYAVYSSVHQSVKETKLKNEVASLNTAVASYLGFGGNLDSVESPEEAISRLRAVASSDLKDRIPGLSGSMVDSRIAARLQNKEEAATDEARVRWNGTKKTFEIAYSGDPGIAEFYINDNDAEFKHPKEAREFFQLYAAEDDWVWDYQDEKGTVLAGPSDVEVTQSIAVTSNPSPGAPLTSSEPHPDAERLDMPGISKIGGAYSIRDYDLIVELSNPNPEGTSDVFYQIDHGAWTKYNGQSITVTPETTLAAEVVSANSSYLDSGSSFHTYEVKSTTLNAPKIRTTSSTFGERVNRFIWVTLEDTNLAEDPSRMEYRVNDQNWKPYDGFFVLDVAEYPLGANVIARAVSDEEYYINSAPTSAVMTVDPSLKGITGGEFHDPDAKKSNLYNLNEDGNFFAWGRLNNGHGNNKDGVDSSNNGASKPYDPSGWLDDEIVKGGGQYAQNWMFFSGQGQDELAVGEQFHIGTLQYYNSENKSNSGVESVRLNLGLDFNLEGQVYESQFDYSLDLRDTADGGNVWDSADSIHIDYGLSNTVYDTGTQEFGLAIEFGDSTEYGLTTWDEFFVQEDRIAVTEIRGTLYDLNDPNSMVLPAGTIESLPAETTSTTIETTNPAPNLGSGNWWSDGGWLQNWVDRFSSWF